jgi:hypothetical protein
MFYRFIKIFTPLSASFDSSNDDVPILISNTYLSAIRTPLEGYNNGHFAIIDHLVNPLSIMFHKYNDQAIGIATG